MGKLLFSNHRIKPTKIATCEIRGNLSLFNLYCSLAPDEIPSAALRTVKLRDASRWRRSCESSFHCVCIVGRHPCRYRRLLDPGHECFFYSLREPESRSINRRMKFFFLLGPHIWSDNHEIYMFPRVSLRDGSSTRS